MRRSSVPLAINGNLVMARLDGLSAHSARIIHISHPNRSAEGISIRTAGGIAHRLAISINRLAAPQHRFGIVEDEDDESPFHPGCLLFQERVASDERLVPIDSRNGAASSPALSCLRKRRRCCDGDDRESRKDGKS